MKSIRYTVAVGLLALFSGNARAEVFQTIDLVSPPPGVFIAGNDIFVSPFLLTGGPLNLDVVITGFSDAADQVASFQFSFFSNNPDVQFISGTVLAQGAPVAGHNQVLQTPNPLQFSDTIPPGGGPAPGVAGNGSTNPFSNSPIGGAFDGFFVTQIQIAQNASSSIIDIEYTSFQQSFVQQEVGGVLVDVGTFTQGTTAWRVVLAIPEPSTYAMVGVLGFAGVIWNRRRDKRKST